MAPGQRGLLSIGALSAATGVPVETIRTWERRYGYPAAARKPSGHRVYPLGTVPRLRLVAQALARGHRAAEVVAASEGALEALLAAVPLPIEPREAWHPELSTSAGVSEATAELIDAVRGFQGERLRGILQRDWARLGPLEFLERRMAPLLTAIGDAWAKGALDVRHEHFASGCLGDFLRTVRAPLDEGASGPVVALATLAGELHGLGLQMSALVFATAGWRVLLLGVNTPAAQITALAREVALDAVAVSCPAPRRPRTAEALHALRRRLPRHIPIVVGGAGAPRLERTRGIEVLADLQQLQRWLQDRRDN